MKAWGAPPAQDQLEKVAGHVLVSIETLIDAGLGTPEDIAWDEARRAERLARWYALPWHVRLWRRHVLPRWRETKHRLRHAYDALRGRRAA